MFPLEHLAKCFPYRDAVVHLFCGQFFSLPEDGAGGGGVAALHVGAAKVDKHLGTPFEQVGRERCGIDLFRAPDGFGYIA